MTIDEIRDQANAITELRRRAAAAEQEANDWQARHQGVTSLWEAQQASYGELQGDYRRLSQAHQELLLAHGSLLREHRALTTGLVIERMPLTTNNPASGDCGIEFTDEMECNRQHCPTSPPHRHITPPHTPKSPGTGVPPCPVRINDIQGTDPRKTTSARFQATIEDDFGDSDVIPTRNPASIRTSTNNNMRPHGTPLDINQAPPASNTSEKGGAQGNPNKEPMDVNNIVGGPNEAELAVARRTYQDALEQKAADIYNQAFDNPEVLQQLRDSARIASKFADASGEAGPTVTDPEVVSDCGFQVQDGSDETRNTPDKQTEDR